VNDDLVRRARSAIDEAGGLVTPADIARDWGVTHQAVEKRIRAGRFPPPVKVAGRLKLYLRAQVEHLKR
jgi:hypothetical protein